MEYTVSLRKTPEQPLGIGFKGLQAPPYCQVGCVLKDSAACEHGEIKEGDLLLQVNGTDVTEKSPDEVRQTLASCSKDCAIELKLRRPAADRGRVRRSGAGVAPVHVTEEDTSPKHLQLTNPNPPTDVRHRRSYTVSNSIDKPIPMVSSHSVEFGELPQYRRLTQHIPLQNLITGTELSDRLHNQSTKVCVKVYRLSVMKGLMYLWIVKGVKALQRDNRNCW